MGSDGISLYHTGIVKGSLLGLFKDWFLTWRWFHTWYQSHRKTFHKISLELVESVLLTSFSQGDVVVISYVWFWNKSNDWYHKHSLSSWSQVNATKPHWWPVNIGSGNGLVPSGTKPLPEPMLTKTYDTKCCHQTSILSYLSLYQDDSGITNKSNDIYVNKGITIFFKVI